MRAYRDWQYFNRKPDGSERLMQACYSGRLWSFGFGIDPARAWLDRRSTKRKPGSMAFHLHSYLPFGRYGPSLKIGFRRKDGSWWSFEMKVKLLLGAAQAVMSAVLVWAIFYDLAHAKNEWWGTTTLCLALLTTAASSVSLFRAGRAQE